MMLVDSFIVILILLISFSLRLGEWFWPEQDILWTIIFAPILAVPIFISLGLYRTVIRFIGFQELWVVFQAVSLYALLWGIIGFMGSIEGIPRSVIIINWLLLILALTAIRTTAKWLFLTLANNKNLSLKCKSLIKWIEIFVYIQMKGNIINR